MAVLPAKMGAQKTHTCYWGLLVVYACVGGGGGVYCLALWSKDAHLWLLVCVCVYMCVRKQ